MVKYFLCFLVFAEVKLVHLLCHLAQQHLPLLLGALAPHLEHQPLHLLLDLATPPLEQEGVSSTHQTLHLALEIHRLVVLDPTHLLGEVLEPPQLSEPPAQLLETRGTNIDYNQKSILALCHLSIRKGVTFSKLPLTCFCPVWKYFCKRQPSDLRSHLFELSEK